MKEITNNQLRAVAGAVVAMIACFTLTTGNSTDTLNNTIMLLVGFLIGGATTSKKNEETLDS